MLYIIYKMLYMYAYYHIYVGGQGLMLFCVCLGKGCLWGHFFSLKFRFTKYILNMLGSVTVKSLTNSLPYICYILYITCYICMLITI
jgi:hypothetical protein